MKYISLITKSILILSLILGSLTADPYLPAHAEEESVIYSEPSRGTVGTEVTIEGIFFSPSVLEGLTSNATRLSEAKIYFPDKDTLCQTAVIDTWGKLNTTIEIGEYPAGTYEIWIHDETAGPLAWKSVPFTIIPKITLDKTSGYIGDTVRVSGTGFDGSSTIKIWYDNTKVNTVTSNEQGSFKDALITIPDKYNNEYTIKAVDNRANEAVVSYTSQRQKIVIYPNSGPPGKEINVIGTGFSTTENITFKIYSPGTIIQDIITDPDPVETNEEGTFDITLTIPVCTSNYYVLEASDGDLRASTSLTVSSSGFFDRNLGYIGSNVTFAGNGFIPFKYSVAYFDDIPLNETKVDINGVSRLSFIVPPCSPGDHTVTVTDGISSYSYTFTVISNANLEINRTSGSVGSKVELLGTGFLSGRVAIISFDGETITEKEIDTSQSFTANFTIPACESGTHTISATEGINTIELLINVNAKTIPEMVLVTSDDINVSGTDAVLTWKQISDFASVNYILQIATDDSFSTDSLVVQNNCSSDTMFIFTPDISYLTETPSTTFFWRVKADSTETLPGEWSESRKFTMTIPVLEEKPEEENPVLSYGIYVEIGALICLFAFWFIKKRRGSSEITPSTADVNA